MNIYDLKLYGVRSLLLAGGDEVTLSQEVPLTYGKATRGFMFMFEVTVLKQYGSKQDVLQLQFVDGHTEYVTLHEPSMYLEEDGEWKLAKDRKVAEKFLAKYNELNDMEAIGENPDIFNLTFYGIQEEYGVATPKVEVSLSKTIRDRMVSEKNVSFTAEILPEHRGKKYVIKAVTDAGEICYISLFNPNEYYDEDKRRWDYCNWTHIPCKILECYVKHLNG